MANGVGGAQPAVLQSSRLEAKSTLPAKHRTGDVMASVLQRHRFSLLLGYSLVCAPRSLLAAVD